MAPSEQTPILDLESTPTERPVVRIDSVSYHIRRLDDLSIAAGIRVEKQCRRAAGLIELCSAEDTPNVEELSAELDNLIAAICHTVLIAPPAVIENLAPGQRLKLLNVFLRLWLLRPLAAKAPIAQVAPPPTGTPSSVAVSDSSGATPSTGPLATH